MCWPSSGYPLNHCSTVEQAFKIVIGLSTWSWHGFDFEIFEITVPTFHLQVGLLCNNCWTASLLWMNLVDWAVFQVVYCSRVAYSGILSTNISATNATKIPLSSWLAQQQQLNCFTALNESGRLGCVPGSR
jgi:hypothetical protein